jgi:type II secretory pathway pseudopilin PulG
MQVRETHPIRGTRLRGITLSETLIAAAGVAVLLMVLSLGMHGIRTELKRQQTVALMQTLDRALLAYQESTGAWPVDTKLLESKRTAPDQSRASGLQDGSGDRVISLLAEVPASRVLLETIPAILRPRNDPGPTTRPWAARVRDPWGNSLRCLTAVSPMVLDRQAVAANQNRPIFISAGPDGRFGSKDISGSSDNIRSDETGG